MTGELIVIGVGNPYRRDDGVGPAVVELLREQGVPGAFLATSLGETDQLIDLWDGTSLAIVVDAVRAVPAHPGRVHRLAVPRGGGERARAASSHGIDLGEAVELARELGRLPERLVLYAVEVDDLGHGVGLTPAVRHAAQRLAEDIAVVARATEQAQAGAVNA
ncbi:MAG TPA: hydrogenase maturation protease [Micromonosporaceae bacterium]|nr:hydrogenase maturation protease [Micromonosporaceae bacterium]